jgi:hypothetical protein
MTASTYQVILVTFHRTVIWMSTFVSRSSQTCSCFASSTIALLWGGKKAEEDISGRDGNPTTGNYGKPSQRSRYCICAPHFSVSWISCTNRNPRHANLVTSLWWTAACRLCRKRMLAVRIIQREIGENPYSCKENSDLFLGQHIHRNIILDGCLVNHHL